MQVEKSKNQEDREGEMELKVYANRFSQPSRAIIIFCKVNGIEFEEVTVDLMKGQHKTPEFKEINPMGQIPAIVHGTFSLFESHAILSYLASAFPEVPAHWYPADIFTRAKVNLILDWHHTNLRRGAASLVRMILLGPAFGYPFDPKVAKEHEEILDSSLSMIESLWLQGDAKFLLGNSRPTVADLSLACEVTQLELLDEDCERILGPHKKIVQWVENVKNALSPHFGEVHEIIDKLKARKNSTKVDSTSNP